jgi:hypothetical protein
MNFMKGYLSYALAVLAIGGGIAGFFLGAIDWEQATAMVWAGLAVFGIRRAVN